MEIKEDTIKAYTLKNAVEHNGMAVQGAVLSGLFAEGLEKSKVKETIPKIKKVLKEVNEMKIEEQKEEFKKLEEKISKREVREEGQLPPLPNAQKGKVIMRFAPFPSGPLHIGNARQLILNNKYCKMYGGKLLLVMDDTIGSKEKPIEPAAYKLIEDGINWLGIKHENKIIYKSDRIEKYYAYADELIKKGYMYVCDCPQEEMRELRAKGIACACRELPPEENYKRWKEMFDKKTPEGKYAVRLKTDIQHPNPAFRDRVMFRISERPHAKLKNKYRVYPLLEFSWAIDDHLLGMTHIIRGNELIMETMVEKFIWDIFKWPHPEVIHTGHFAIEGVKVSKSKGSKEVKSGKYIGWNDPRLWSLQSLKDRGFKPEAIKEFILNMGITKSNSTIPIEVLYSLNKNHLPEVPKYFFVEEPEKIHIKGTPPMETEIQLNQKEKLGSRKMKTEQDFLIPKIDYDLMENKKYRLIGLLTFKSDQVLKTKPRDFTFVTDEPEKGLKPIEWLPANANNPKVKIRMDDGTIKEGVGEESLKNLNENRTIYLEKLGYVTLHKKHKDFLEFWWLHN